MDEHLRIRIALELMTAVTQFFAQGIIVLNYAIMDDGQFLIARVMRMRIAVVRLAMRSPTGVTNANGT
jgi:hypothetical protein